MSRLILPFDRRPVVAGSIPATPAPGEVIPFAASGASSVGPRARPFREVPIEELGAILATQTPPGLSLGAAAGKVAIRASVGPLSIPMFFSPDEARNLVVGVAKAIEAAEGASPDGPEPDPAGAPDAAPPELVPDDGPDHPGLPFLPSEAATDA